MKNFSNHISFVVMSISLFFLIHSCKVKTLKIDNKLQVLILTGSNNHNWKSTTNQLQSMYAESEMFTTIVTEAPDTLKYRDFKKFDVILSNWNAWPEGEIRWPKSAKNGLMKYIDEGGGFVLFHAANAAFYDWDDFHKLVGAKWKMGSTTHGEISKHKIIIKNKTHPITKGMDAFWITDELWVNTEMQPNVNLLAASYSDPKNKGRGLMEPVMLWNTKGKGRCFHSILGHDVEALQNSNLKTIMLRGTEWAATGKVTNNYNKVSN